MNTTNYKLSIMFKRPNVSRHYICIWEWQFTFQYYDCRHRHRWRWCWRSFPPDILLLLLVYGASLLVDGISHVCHITTKFSTGAFFDSVCMQWIIHTDCVEQILKVLAKTILCLFYMYIYSISHICVISCYLSKKSHTHTHININYYTPCSHE